MEALKVLPAEIQQKWKAQLHRPDDSPDGIFRLVKIRPQNDNISIIVHVIDEYGMALSGRKVIFSYSTAEFFLVDPASIWTPPQPWRGDVIFTDGAGEAEHIQGSVVKKDQPGGVTVYILDPKYASDYVSGAGLLADHTGMHMTFQLQRPGVKSLEERVNDLEQEMEEIRTSVKGMVDVLKAVKNEGLA